MAPAVHLSNAVVLAGRFPVLAGVDLELEAGQVLVVLGHNGAGKTSLLRLLAGLAPLSSGEGRIFDRNLKNEARQVRCRVGMLGHDVGLYDDLSPLENLRFALRAARVDPAAGPRALDRCAIGDRVATTPLGALSAGQRRRVGLALLCARRPELWLLDEPHASLDAATRQLVGELVEEAALGGATVVATSHEPEIAVPMADVVATMAGGIISATARGGRARGEAGGHVA